MKNNLKAKKINLGIEILRLILCLWIVIIHCSSLKNQYRKYFFRRFHVPTFFSLSFFFFYDALKNRIIDKIITRFLRLLIPYIIWPLLILLLNNILLEVFAVGQYYKILTLKDFYIQILMAAGFYFIFWFHFNLIFISLVFTIISFIFKEVMLNILLLLAILSFYFHYSKLNFYFFNSFNQYFRLNMGSLVEMVPNAVLGCFFKNINLFSIINDFSIYYKFVLFSIILLLFKFDIFIRHYGFRYPDILLNFFASIILILLFGSFDFEKFQSNKFILFLSIITKYTGGIYYIHDIFRDYFRKYILYFRKGNIFSSFIIYIICYFICLLGNKLFKKNKLNYLFN